MNRPVGKRPEADRSDWTEQDLLTREEALPRLLEAIEEVEVDYQSASDPVSREQIGTRLRTMHAIAERLARPPEPGQ
jgi:hypothetical protein